MHDIEPYYRWREYYIAAEDSDSPFFGRQYSEVSFTHRLYNFYLHPQWDAFGSSTLYGKILFADYEEGYALIELIGEWNDALHNDIMYLKRNIADHLYDKGISKYVFFCENVLNYHSTLDDDYYAEWYEEVTDEMGWIVLVNTRQHFQEEMEDAHLDRYLLFGEHFNDLHWQIQPKPQFVYAMIEALVHNRVKRIS